MSLDLDNLAPYDPDTALPKAIIVDIDGCVALGPEEYTEDNASYFVPNNPVIHCVQAMYQAGYKLIYITGRQQKYRNSTFRWLIENTAPFAELYMSPDGASEDATPEFKYTTFNEHIRENYNVDFTLENRKETVQMWRAIGLASFKVHPDSNS